MPEGPETKRMSDLISKSLVGKDIISYTFFHEQLLDLNMMKDISVLNALSRGKAIIIRINDGLSIISHNQLYGKWTFNRPQTSIKTNRQLRIEFMTKTKVVRLWSATDISLYRTNQELEHPYLRRIGPDVLDDVTNDLLIFDRLIDKRFCNRKLSGTLLDQSFISGLGNYLRSEILFFSGLNHLQKPSKLSDSQLKQLSKEIKNVSLRAYIKKGRTIDSISIEKLFGNINNFKKIRHMVFGRDGQPCFLCGQTIVKVFALSRRIYFCPDCQKCEIE